MNADNYFQGMTPEEISQYKTDRLKRWFVSVFSILISLILIWFTLWLVFASWAIYMAIPLWLAFLYYWMFERCFKQTGSSEVLILENPLARRKGASTGTVDEIEPLPGYMAIPPRSFAASYFWEGEVPRIDINTEVLVSSKDLDGDANTLYTKDKKTVRLGWQINVRPLAGSVKYICNWVRYGDATQREKFTREQILTYVAPELRDWTIGLEYGDGKKDLTLASFQKKFKMIFRGKKLHPVEMRLASWTGEPKGISLVLVEELQKSQEMEGRIRTALKLAERIFKKDPARLDYGMIVQQQFAALGIPTAGIQFNNVRLTGDPNIAAALATQLEAMRAAVTGGNQGGNRGGNTTP